MIRTVHLPRVVCLGADGSATGSAVSLSPVNGRVLAVHLDHSAAAGTTDVTLATVAPPVTTILAKGDSLSDGWLYPALPLSLTADGSPLDVYVSPAVDDYLSVAVAQANNNQTLDVTLLVEEAR